MLELFNSNKDKMQKSLMLGGKLILIIRCEITEEAVVVLADVRNSVCSCTCKSKIISLELIGQSMFSAKEVG